MQSSTQSSPYGIVINNPTGTPFSLNVFGAWNNLQNGTFSNGSLIPDNNKGASVSGAFSNVTYQYLLNQSVIVPFTIGATQIYCVNNNAQATQPMTLTTTDANGDSESRPIIWLLNPFQNQSGTLISTNNYRIDGSTTLNMNVLANSQFYVYFYPIANVDNARKLVGQSNIEQFSKPDLTPANTVVIKN